MRVRTWREVSKKASMTSQSPSAWRRVWGYVTSIRRPYTMKSSCPGSPSKTYITHRALHAPATRSVQGQVVWPSGPTPTVAILAPGNARMRLHASGGTPGNQAFRERRPPGQNEAPPTPSRDLTWPEPPRRSPGGADVLWRQWEEIGGKWEPQQTTFCQRREVIRNL